MTHGWMVQRSRLSALPRLLPRRSLLSSFGEGPWGIPRVRCRHRDGGLRRWLQPFHHHTLRASTHPPALTPRASTHPPALPSAVVPPPPPRPFPPMLPLVMHLCLLLCCALHCLSCTSLMPPLPSASLLLSFFLGFWGLHMVHGVHLRMVSHNPPLFCMLHLDLPGLMTL